MFAMLRQFFQAFMVLFAATEKVAKSFDNLATIGQEMSEGYLNEYRLEQEIKLKRLKSEAANQS